MISKAPFDRSKHVYRSDAFVELVKDAVRFFNGTPIHPLQVLETFTGTGVYAIYYTGSHDIYAKYGVLNRLAYNFPIYVGKAVPKGWRQSRISNGSQPSSRELQNRLKEHARNIEKVPDLDLKDLACRFIIFEDATSDMIGTIEASLIKLSTPLWNSGLDGFGNHDPGKGRYQQAKSDWDVLHPGRDWADRCLGIHQSKDSILQMVESFVKNLGSTE
jgi:Eco29kI restriction endonuclease